MNHLEINRAELRLKAQRESLDGDLKQHADKLILGFEVEDESYAKRAIWRLVQNVRDLSEQSDIVITLELDRLPFPITANPLLQIRCYY